MHAVNPHNEVTQRKRSTTGRLQWAKSAPHNPEQQ